MKKIFVISGCHGAGKTTASYTGYSNSKIWKEFQANLPKVSAKDEDKETSW